MPNSGFNSQPFSYQFDTNSMLNNYQNNYQTPNPQSTMGTSNIPQGNSPNSSGNPGAGIGFQSGRLIDPNNMSFGDHFWGGRDGDGNLYGSKGQAALGAANSLMTGYLGYQNMKTAQDALKFQKNAFSKQFRNQRTLVNNDLRDRDRMRQQFNPNYQSTTQFA